MMFYILKTDIEVNVEPTEYKLRSDPGRSETYFIWIPNILFLKYKLM